MADRRDGWVVTIGGFKLAKAAALLALGIAGLRAGPQGIAARLVPLYTWLGTHPGHHLAGLAIDRLAAADPAQARRLALVSLGYALVFLVEGVGLVLRRRWAEWLTVVVTASFVPFEVYELVVHFGAGKLCALAVNVAVVVYLARRRLQERRGPRLAGHRPPAPLRVPPGTRVTSPLPL